MHGQHDGSLGLAKLIGEGVVRKARPDGAGGLGRVLAAEVLVATSGVRNLIREDKVHQVGAALETGAVHGMQSMDRSLAMLVRERRVDAATEGFQELIR